MKILFVSRYAEPSPKGGNRNVFLQAMALREQFGIEVEILTWPLNDLWTGPVPDKLEPPLSVRREGLLYHVFDAPLEWNEIACGNIISDAAWNEAVAFGMRMLSSLKPDLVHLQHRHGLWWMLDSAQRLGIATIYSNHDWGIGCLRTVLVKGDHSLCDGVVNPEKCALCIVRGRGIAGKANEALVRTEAGQAVVGFLEHTPLWDTLKRRGVVRYPALTRATLNRTRAERVISKLNHCFTPSKFGRRFFLQFGIPAERITVLPWYHEPVNVPKNAKSDQPFTITYIGRISPEKGVHLIFEALKSIDEIAPVNLRIAGACDSAYGSALRKRYPDKAGVHSVNWLGWTAVEPLYRRTDVVIIPSVCIDNTPLSLIEAMSYRVPAVATRVPPIEELICDGENGFLADYMSVSSLADAIRRAVSKMADIRSGALGFPVMLDIHAYMARIVETYRAAARHAEVV